MGGDRHLTIHDNHGEINIGVKRPMLRPSGILCGRAGHWPHFGSRYKKLPKLILKLLDCVPPWREIRVCTIANLMDLYGYHVRDALEELEDSGKVVSTKHGPYSEGAWRSRWWRRRQPEDEDPKLVARALELRCERCKAWPGKSCTARTKPHPAEREECAPHGDRLRAARER